MPKSTTKPLMLHLELDLVEQMESIRKALGNPSMASAMRTVLRASLPAVLDGRINLFTPPKNDTQNNPTP